MRVCACMHVSVYYRYKQRRVPILTGRAVLQILENGENRNINNFPEQNKNVLFFNECYFLHRNLTCNKTAPLLLTANLFLVFKTETKTKNKTGNYHRRVFLGEWFLSAPSVPFPD